MLDPPIAFSGRVLRGAQIGRALGFPTANLRVGPQLDHVPFGVYAGRALDRPAAISIGVRPTFGDGLEPLIEGGRRSCGPGDLEKAGSMMVAVLGVARYAPRRFA